MLPFGNAGVAGLRDLVSVARSRNATLNATGVLYFDGAYFMQVLKGPRASVLALFSSIVGDPRHREIKISFSGPLAERDFPGWTMALVDDEALSSARSVHPVIARDGGYRVPESVGVMRHILDVSRPV